MRPILIALLFACSWTCAAAARGYIQEFNTATAIENSDPESALTAYALSFQQALAAEDVDYATSAGLNSCYILHRQGKLVEAGNLACKTIEAINPLPCDFTSNDITRRSALFGFTETAWYKEGRIGEAWRANRATAESLRGRNVTPTGDGPSITVREVKAMPQVHQGLGWRCIDQEARLLNSSGRTLEAMALLNEASVVIRRQWPNLQTSPQFYAFKVLMTQSDFYDFLGICAEAIEMQKINVQLSEGIPELLSSHRVEQMNLLRNLSQWEGPSEEILMKAREVCRHFENDKVNTTISRQLALMELDLHESQEAMDTIEADAIDSAQRQHWYDTAYADRDLLISRANRGDENLDAEFARLLGEFRKQGNKAGEPTLYRAYGNYLLERGRPAEAIPMFAESLRLTRVFGWRFHEPDILFSLFQSRFAAGDVAGARATLAELESFLAAHPNLPVARQVTSWVNIAKARIQLGEIDAARAALDRARPLATDLPEYRKRWLTPDGMAAILDGKTDTDSPSAAPSGPPLPRVQPLEIVSVATPGEAARTTFSIFNPSATRIRGNWLLTGPGATVARKSVTFAAGQPPASVRIPATLDAGADALLAASITAAEDVTTTEITVAWENTDRKSGPPSKWKVSWDPAAARSIVLDASALEAGPFRFATLHHELAVPLGEDLGVPFRLRSPTPLRFEYYDSRTNQLLAIDANGNGDFTEAGDLHLRGPGGVAAAIVPIAPQDSQVSVQILIFAIDGSPPAATDAPLILEAETHRSGGWTKEAEDTIR